MKTVRFVREFHWWGPKPGCVLCKALALFWAKPSPAPVEVPENVAERAVASGAAVEVEK